MTKTVLSSLLALSVLVVTGCGILRPVSVDDAASVARATTAIHNTAREGTYIAIKKIYEDDRDGRVLAAFQLKNVLDEYVMPVLNNPETQITISIQDELLSHVPEIYHGLMATAYETFHSYYEFPATSEVLPEPYLTYLKAFFAGVREGAFNIIYQEGATEGTTIFLPEEE